ncbi:MAG: hypothetical protein RL514_4741, partial [Verrucomicrobiota bacterium]
TESDTPPQAHGESQNGGHNCGNHPSFKKLLDSIWFGDGYLTKARAYRVAVHHVAAWKN